MTTLATTLLLLSQGALAQTPPAANNSLERAQKAADAVFHWIKVNADKGASRQPPAPAPAPAPVVRKAAPVATAPRPAPAPAPRSLPEAADAPAPAVIAASPDPEPDAAPLMVAAASPTPMPAAPLALAAQAVQPPPPPPEETEVPLKLLNRVNPTIPTSLQRQTFRDAYARVKFVVAPDGSVRSAQSIQASHSRLATAAVDAVKQWRFAPIPEAREAAIEFAFSNVDE